MTLHSSFKPPQSADEPTVFDIDADIARETTLIPRLPEDRFLCSFMHIFGGAYSAGYYRWVIGYVNGEKIERRRKRSMCLYPMCSCL